MFKCLVSIVEKVMANKVRKILFYADGTKGELNALNRAHTFARSVGAELLVMGVVKEVSTSDVRLQKSINQIQKTLIYDRGIELDTLIACIKAEKANRVPMKKLVVPGKDYLEVANLNNRLLEVGVSISEAEGAELDLLYVLEHPLEDEKSTHKDAYKDLEQSLKADAERRLGELAEDTSGLKLSDHVLKGKPHTAIAKYVANNNIDLLVMGSVARSGLPGLLVGNTAERILNHIGCSVLVVKPDGWKSPVV